MRQPIFALTGLPSRSAVSAKTGGARRDRTADLVNAIHALSQLSYGPIRSGAVSGRRVVF